jgi:hypothetical protein
VGKDGLASRATPARPRVVARKKGIENLCKVEEDFVDYDTLQEKFMIYIVVWVRLGVRIRVRIMFIKRPKP